MPRMFNRERVVVVVVGVMVKKESAHSFFDIVVEDDVDQGPAGIIYA